MKSVSAAHTAYDERLPRAAFIFFFVPSLIYSICGLNYSFAGIGDLWYRLAGFISAGLLIAAAFSMPGRKELRLSITAKTILWTLVVSVFVHLFTLVFQFRPDFKMEMVLVAAQFLAIVIPFDLLSRRYSFADFCEWAAPVAFCLLVISTINLLLFEPRIWGRATYFGNHPNLGGEMMFVSASLLAFNKRPWMRYAAYAMSLYGLFVMQSRGAMLATVVVIAAAEMPRDGKALARWAVALCAFASILGIALLSSPEVLKFVTKFVVSDVLQIDNPYRGSDSGFVGREDTWNLAYDEIAARPITGSGLYNSGITLGYNLPIHNGFLKNFAELGIVGGALINATLFTGAFFAARTDIRRCAVILASLFMMLFAPRGIALNTFPLIVWIAILPWRPHREETAALRAQPLGHAPQVAYGPL